MNLILLFMFAVLFVAKVFGHNEYSWLQVFSPLLLLLAIILIEALLFKDDE